MNWKSFDEFVQMGGYGLYVWGSYAVAIVVMLVEASSARRRLRRALRAAAREGAATEGRP